MTDNIWFPFYLGSYAKRAGYLTQGQHGAFISLLRYYYTNHSPIPHEERYAIAYAHAEQEQCNTDFVLGKFFHREGEVWRSAKADKILKDINDISKKRRNAAKERWSKSNASAYANAYANALHLDTQLQSQSHDKDKSLSLTTESKKRENLGKRLEAYFERNPNGGYCPSEWNAWCYGQFGWSETKCHAVFATFNDYWIAQPGQKGVKTDWTATWRNWCRRAAERPSNTGQTGGGVPSKSLTALSRAMAARRGVAGAQGFTDLSSHHPAGEEPGFDTGGTDGTLQLGLNSPAGEGKS